MLNILSAIYIAIAATMISNDADVDCRKNVQHVICLLFEYELVY
jgi:hypothetical protein